MATIARDALAYVAFTLPESSSPIGVLQQVTPHHQIELARQWIKPNSIWLFQCLSGKMNNSILKT